MFRFIHQASARKKVFYFVQLVKRYQFLFCHMRYNKVTHHCFFYVVVNSSSGTLQKIHFRWTPGLRVAFVRQMALILGRRSSENSWQSFSWYMQFLAEWGWWNVGHTMIPFCIQKRHAPSLYLKKRKNETKIAEFNIIIRGSEWG